MGLFAPKGVASALLLGLLVLAPARPAQDTARVLIVGGGPNPGSNQVAIESNVRWVDTLVPSRMERRILFCDGRSDSRVVQYASEVPAEEQALGFLFRTPEGNAGAGVEFRVSTLGRIDGASTGEGFGRAVEGLAGASTPVVMYFTGHGSPDRRDPDNNRYDFWNEPGITPSALAAQIARLPKGTPVTVLMVQCFSGAFANLIFDNADPKGPLADRPICGFFAATREREAAGCTPELNEAEYRDFTSSFFAALTGRDRVGRKVVRPDYDGNGTVGFDEAYAYSLVNDPSIDVPVVTSDAFLRRFVPVTDDEEIVAVPWERIRGSATLPQRAALDGLCAALGERANGPDRVRVALEEFRRRLRQGDARPRFPDDLRREILELRGLLEGIHPDLALPDRVSNPTQEQKDAYRKAWRSALAWLSEHPETSARVAAMGNRYESLGKGAANDAIAGARWLRLLRLAKTIVLELRLREGKDTALIRRFDALRAMESANPLAR